MDILCNGEVLNTTKADSKLSGSAPKLYSVKSNLALISNDGTRLETVPRCQYLGSWLDSVLYFEYHIEHAELNWDFFYTDRQRLSLGQDSDITFNRLC